MAYRLSFEEGIAVSVRAVAHEELGSAVARLREGAVDPVEAVHETRKSLKKTRALLRLVRSDLPDEVFARENHALRDAARLLGGLRDADVLTQTLASLAERFEDRVGRELFDRVRVAVATGVSSHAGAGASGNGAATIGPISPDAVAALEAIDGRIASWPLEDIDARTVVRGIATAYRRGRSGKRLADQQPSSEQLHDWRKRVKDLWYHHRLLCPAWPSVLTALGEQAHALSELLGDDHDLAVLAERVAPPELAHEHGLANRYAGIDIQPVFALIDEARGELLERSRRLGARLYAESPHAFSKRIERLLRAAEVELSPR